MSGFIALVISQFRRRPPVIRLSLLLQRSFGAVFIMVMAVGMIFDPKQAEDIVASGQADLIAIARAALDDPHWAHHAAVALGEEERLPEQYARAGNTTWPGYGRSV